MDAFIANLNRLIINPLILLLFALALVYFLWGVLEFMVNQDNEEKRTTGKKHMVWGIVGLTIMVGVFAIMSLILRTFNISGVNLKTGEVQLR
ncbi:hypothetical protein A3G06_01535 [Candidatus Nomurabacteria bacterium RIFCSPLOWO2_12_FULL_46_14]|uniref:Uncharacterized protein n=1 Tax=Candidatus Nomurabacteria bacterium RIFCSPLOWO2_12_FULL_46_14 TaxID=1801797 RepID=A0A1F6YBX6_9BACT|nr:MAG: hypothetical protein A3G06_01535 [Candidatus Nomurabacteria bacterium RIFCSPLOWO2_12_FULL_46_14]